jgi:two-component system NtrC family sensor kinase
MDSSHDQRIARSVITKEGLNSFVGVPIYAADRIVGVMNILTRPPESLDEEVINLVAAIGSHVGSAILNAQHFAELKKAEEELRKAKDEIEAWNRELETRVQEKSEELIKSQAQLIQSEKRSAMGQIAGGLAHELNSPLAGLLPLIEKYRDKAEKGSEAYHELDLMLNASRHMAKIVRDFGFFSMESKGEFAELSLNRAIDDTLNFSAGRLMQKGIQIIKEYEDNLPMINGNKTELQQVVLNMVTNAHDAMSDGGKFIIKTGTSEDRSKVTMEFIDNGIGIEKEGLDNIFDPFFGTKGQGKGVGLGLSLSYGIIKKHGGDISVESEPGEGTRFTVFLPAVK